MSLFTFAVGSNCAGHRAHAHPKTEACRAEKVFAESGY